MTTPPDNQRGVSLYSYQEEYFLRTMSLEDCIAAAAATGARGIETIAEQMMPGFPRLPDAFYAQWHEWMRRYDVVPTAHDMFAELKLYADRPRPTEEMVADLLLDIEHTARLGATVIRILAATPPEVVERAAPAAAEKGVRLLTELHAPRRFDSEWFAGHYEVAQRVGPDVVGFLPDMGIFVRKLPRVMWERALRDGATEDWTRHVVEVYDSGADTSGLPEEARRRGLGPLDVELAEQATRYIWEDPRQLREYMPYIHHVHAKFYEMTDEGVEYSIPYEEIVPIFQEGGFRGSFSSEYEGNRHIEDAYPVDSVEQVRRHQDMLARLLGEA